MSETNSLGALVRRLRRDNGWTLRQMSDKTGTPLSTLAKVESDKLSLTYDKLQQFASRLGFTMAEFLAQAEAGDGRASPKVVMARRSVATEDNSVRITTPNYDYEYLCADLREQIGDGDPHIRVRSS